MDGLETECAVACLTIEVRVHVIQRAPAIALTDFILHRAAPILDGMDEMVRGKERQHPEDARLVHSLQLCFL